MQSTIAPVAGRALLSPTGSTAVSDKSQALESNEERVGRKVAILKKAAGAWRPSRFVVDSVTLWDHDSVDHMDHAVARHDIGAHHLSVVDHDLAVGYIDL